MKFRLCVMMFLQILIWGAWYPLFFDYVPSLGFTGWQKDLILNAFHISAVVAIFFGNQFADRTFAAEKFLAFSHLVGGLAMIGLTFITRPSEDEQAPFWPFFGLLMLHTLLYVPTISITNSITFSHLKESSEFAAVRMWGTIGWIAVQWPFVFILLDWAKVPSMGQMGFFDWLGAAFGSGLTGAAYRDMARFMFMAAGLASLALAAFSLTLPHTPPKPGEPLAWLEATKQLARPFIFVLFVVTFLDAAVHQSYFYWTATYLKSPEGARIPSNWVTPVMSIGQVAEILTMAILGYVLKSLGWRMTMVIGILGHAARFGVFAYYPAPAPAIVVNVLHGICYAFFFATVYIFIDEYFPKNVRASAQGLFNLLMLGVGPFASNYVSGILSERYKTSVSASGAAHSWNYQAIFMYPMFTALAAAIILLLFFHPPKKQVVPEPVPVGEGTP
jgi:predicted MFS family arabinose efflux permease